MQETTNNLIKYYDLRLANTIVGQGGDLNNYLTPNSWSVPSATVAATIKNMPITSYGGRIIIECLGSSTNLKQSFLCHNGVTYERIYTGGEWKAWRKLATEPA